MKRDKPTKRQAEILRVLARWPHDEDNYVHLHDLGNPSPRTVGDLIDSGWVVWEDELPGEGTHAVYLAITSAGRAVIEEEG